MIIAIIIIIALFTVTAFTCCHELSKDEIYISIEVENKIKQADFVVSTIEIGAICLDESIRELEKLFNVT